MVVFATHVRLFYRPANQGQRVLLTRGEAHATQDLPAASDPTPAQAELEDRVTELIERCQHVEEAMRWIETQHGLVHAGIQQIERDLGVLRQSVRTALVSTERRHDCQ